MVYSSHGFDCKLVELLDFTIGDVDLIVFVDMAVCSWECCGTKKTTASCYGGQGKKGITG